MRSSSDGDEQQPMHQDLQRQLTRAAVLSRFTDWIVGDQQDASFVGVGRWI